MLYGSPSHEVPIVFIAVTTCCHIITRVTIATVITPSTIKVEDGWYHMQRVVLPL